MILTSNKFKPISINLDNQLLYKPYIKINMDGTNDPSTTFIYKLVGRNDALPIYVLTEKKGMGMNGRNVYEYN